MTGRLHVHGLNPTRLLPMLELSQALIESPNLAPRQPISAIRREGSTTCLTTLFWGLTPPWLNVLDHAPHCARAESLESRSMFREAFHARRCLIPVTGVYIWKSRPRAKQPFLVTEVGRAPLLLAGIWCRYHTSLTQFNDSTALITVPANAWLSRLSDRLPAIIHPDQAPSWLDPATPVEEVNALLTPAPLELLGAFPVSTRVNNPAYQSSDCAYPVGSMLRWASSQEL
ncbi:SOS response-associated peptidase [Halomonas sp. ZH2S]|uniref:Abasic site processing protein n=1 Tax=Vreelandella zhuhanensis TaxID=2684210 RepID=A0A7X3GYR8_9GAMM|nr:SOS response-associated peptidase [Halomonas zhuhanensis]MWJ27401.1 SOS response-associated peptidase [Halomonas zhuhanensis]